MAGEVKLPGVGGVSKKALWIGGGAAVLVMTLLYLRKRKNAAAAATANPVTGDPNAVDTSGLDPSLLDSGMAGGGGGPFAPSFPIGAVTAPTSNAQWDQAVTQQLGGTVDPGALSAALGVYLTGGQPTGDQESLIDQAIAIEGYPPVAGVNGYPPGIRQSPTSGQTTATPSVTSSPPPATTPASSPSASPAAPAASSPARYVTVGHYGVDPISNTTVDGIAAANGITEAKLLQLNPNITNPNLIYPGQRIRVA